MSIFAQFDWQLYRHLSLDCRVALIAFEVEILDAEVADVLDFRVEHHLRQWQRLARELEVDLIEMVEIDVGIAERVDEGARLKASDLCHHHDEKRVRGDVERHAKESVGTALVKLERELAVGNIELEETVAGRKPHLVDLRHVP